MCALLKKPENGPVQGNQHKPEISMGLVLKYTAVWRICARRHQDENVYIMEPRQKCQNSGRNLVAMGLYWNGSAPNYTNNTAQMQQRAPAAGWAACLLHQNTPQKIECAPVHISINIMHHYAMCASQAWLALTFSWDPPPLLWDSGSSW